MFFILKTMVAVFVLAAFPAIAAEQPEIFVQLGHSAKRTTAGAVKSVAFSPDGKYALSGGGHDNTLKLWEVSTGKEIRTFKGHTDGVYAVAFSPDGKYALSGSRDTTLKLWDIETGAEIRTFKGHTNNVLSVAISPNGKYALSGAHDYTLRLWNIETGKEIRAFRHADYVVYAVAFSPDGSQALSGGSDKTLRLWDIETGAQLKTWFTGAIFSIAFSPNGKVALSSGGYDSSGSYERSFKLWDVGTGKEIRTFTGHRGGVPSVAFSPDGRYALSGSSDATLKLWEIETGAEIRTFKGHTHDVYAVTFSPNGKYALSGGGDNTLRLWELSTGAELRTFTGFTKEVFSVGISPDSKYALSGSQDALHLWDISKGKELRKLPFQSGAGPTLVAFSHNGKYALSGNYDTLKLWEISTGKEIRTFGQAEKIRALAFSSDDRYGLSVSLSSIFKLWEVSTGKEIKAFDVKAEPDQSNVGIVHISPDGRYVVSKGNGDFKLFDVATRKEIRRFINSSASGPMSFSNDCKVLLSTTWNTEDNAFILWDMGTGKELKSFTGHVRHVTAASFSSDGRYVLSGSLDGTIKLWDIETGKETRTFAGHTGEVHSISFSADKTRAFSGSDDSTLRIWDVSTGKELAKFISFIDDEWIVITPDGYYNSSANGDRHLNVRIGNNVYGIDQYRSVFYKPQMVEAALSGKDTQIVSGSTSGAIKPPMASIQNMEPPFIVIKSPEDGKKVSVTNAELSIYLEDRNQTIKIIKVYVNGRQVTAEMARGVKIVGVIPEGKKALDLKIPVRLDAGENLIEVTAFNGFSEGRKSIRLVSETANTAASGDVLLPNLWILSIGINKYQDKKLTSLSYAVADAEGIVAAFQGQKGKLFREVNSLVIHDNSSMKPTRDTITDNLDYVKKAGSNDVAILFIAGHGINDDSGEFFFLPSDAVITDDGSIKKSKAISWRDIKAILDIPAKKVIFADTCHSEGVSGKKTRGVDNDSFVKELQEANAVIFTSSRGRELSQESDKWKHGAFTHALIEGIKGNADLIKDGKISMKELDAYVSETVPKITNGAQHPITNTPEGYVNFPVALVK